MEAQVYIFSRRQSARKDWGNIFPQGGRNLYVRIWEGSSICAKPLWKHSPPLKHFMPGKADGMAGFIEGDVIWGIFRRFCPPVDINEGIDIPVFEQLIGEDVVICGVKADIFRWNAKGIAPEIIHGIEEVFAVMAACVSEFH